MQVVEIKITTESFASLLAGLYCMSHNAEPYAIPTYFWMMLAESMIPHLETWQYDIQSLEDWITNYLIITAKEVCTPEELSQMKHNALYIEALNGNLTLVATAPIIWEETDGDGVL